MVDPLSYFSFWCNKGCGMCYPVCGMMHIKEPFLLIGKSSPCGGSGLPFSLSEWSFTIMSDIKVEVRRKDTLNTFYLQLHGVRHMVKDHRDRQKGNYIDYYFLLAGSDLLYAPFHRQVSTYHGLWYNCCGTLAEMRNSSRIDPMTRHTMDSLPQSFKVRK